MLPLSHTLDTPGPITRDIEDAALLLGVLQGADPNDAHTMTVRSMSIQCPDCGAGVKRLRLGAAASIGASGGSMPRC